VATYRFRRKAFLIELECAYCCFYHCVDAVCLQGRDWSDGFE
jgi:hypothetical protein